MLLAIDVGNTQSCFALWDGDALRGSWRLSTDPHRSGDTYACEILFLLGLDKLSAADIDAVIIASVVPDAVFPLRQFSKRYLNCEAIMVRHDVTCSVKVDIHQPQEVGADRLVNAVAAWERYKTGVIVVDFGTATTFDVVSDEGTYIGGVIAPGVNLSLEALQRAAAKLHGVRITRPQTIIGKDTTHAMQAGIYYGYLSLIEGIVERIRREYGKALPVIATGGLASLFAADNPLIEAVEPDLTMQGLRLIYECQTAQQQTTMKANG